MDLIPGFFYFLLEVKSHLVRRAACCLCHAEGGLWMLSVEIRQHALLLYFLEEDSYGEFWKEEDRQSFLSL